MLKFIVKRIAFTILTIWTVATFTFFLMHCLPGKPFTSEKFLPPQIMKNLTVQYGLDKPLSEQYYKYMSNLLKGDLGISMVYSNKTVNSIIERTFPVSLVLGLRALILSSVLGILLGIISAFYNEKTPDKIILAVAITTMSVPCFIFGILIQYFLCFKLSYLIGQSTHGTFSFLPLTGWGSFKFTIAPTLALTLSTFGIITGIMRTSMLDTIKQNYILTARAKGLNNTEIILKHVVKNSILPVISIMGTITTSIIMGSFVIENIFSVPGLGKYFVTSIQSKDYTMILGLAIFTVFCTALINTLVDIIYMIIDPRIRSRINIT